MTFSKSLILLVVFATLFVVAMSHGHRNFPHPLRHGGGHHGYGLGGHKYPGYGQGIYGAGMGMGYPGLGMGGYPGLGMGGLNYPAYPNYGFGR